MPTGPPDQSPPVEADLGCPALDALAHHVSALAHLVTRPHDATLTEWIKAVRADDLPAPHAHVSSLERDLDAVTAGLTLPHSFRKGQRGLARRPAGVRCGPPVASCPRPDGSRRVRRLRPRPIATIWTMSSDLLVSAVGGTTRRGLAGALVVGDSLESRVRQLPAVVVPVAGEAFGSWVADAADGRARRGGPAAGLSGAGRVGPRRVRGRADADGGG